MIRALLLAALTALLAACGTVEDATGIPDPFGLPHPFEGDGDPQIVGEVLGERAVFVGPIKGLSPEADAALRKQIATNAGALDVLASETMTPGALNLTGVAGTNTVAFTLFDGAKALAQFSAAGEPPVLAAEAARQLASTLGRLSATAAAVVPEAVAETNAVPLKQAAPSEAPAPKPGEASQPTKTAEAAKAPKPSSPAGYIGEIKASSPKLSAPLKRAIDQALADMGVRMMPGKTDETYVITATLTLGPDQGGQTGVSIVWRVAAPDGRDLGKAEQTNAVPTKEVQGNWAEMATLAGGAAASSVANIIASDFNRQ